MAERVYDWKQRTYTLWELLDDIDTASDMFKPTDLDGFKAFYNYVMKKVEKRNRVLVPDDNHNLIPPGDKE